MNVLSGNGDFGEEMLLDSGVIRILVVERDDSFIREEDLPISW